MNTKNIKVGTLITTDMLEEMKACNQQVQIFKREWPNGMRIRKKNLLRAAELRLNVHWFAEIFKAGEEYNKYGDLFIKHRTGSAKKDAALAFWEVIRERR